MTDRTRVIASPYWSDETTMLELGERAFMASDEGTAIEHRLAQANGLAYGCPPRHWSWDVIPAAEVNDG